MKELSFKFSFDGKTIGKNIDTWAKVMQAGIPALHTLVVSTICHAIKHGDTTLMNKLDVACRFGVDRKGNTASGLYIKGMREYIKDVAPVKWQKKDAAAGKDEGWPFSFGVRP